MIVTFSEQFSISLSVYIVKHVQFTLKFNTIVLRYFSILYCHNIKESNLQFLNLTIPQFCITNGYMFVQMQRIQNFCKLNKFHRKKSSYFDTNYDTTLLPIIFTFVIPTPMTKILTFGIIVSN